MLDILTVGAWGFNTDGGLSTILLKEQFKFNVHKGVGGSTDAEKFPLESDLLTINTADCCLLETLLDSAMRKNVSQAA